MYDLNFAEGINQPTLLERPTWFLRGKYLRCLSRSRRVSSHCRDALIEGAISLTLLISGSNFATKKISVEVFESSIEFARNLRRDAKMEGPEIYKITYTTQYDLNFEEKTPEVFESQEL